MGFFYSCNPTNGGSRTPSCSFEEMVSLTNSGSSEGSNSTDYTSRRSTASIQSVPLQSSPIDKKFTESTLSLKSSFAMLVSGLAILSLVFVRSAGSTSRTIEHFAIARPFPTHGSSFGGKLNLGHAEGHNRSSTDSLIEKHKQYVPAHNTNTGAVRSLSSQNVLNLRGHYIHDEHRSPYASHLYDAPEEVLQSIQDSYVKKMDRVRKEWGAWSFVDPGEDIYGPKGRDRPVTDFTGIPYKDLDRDQFVEGSWQTDEAYVTEFISEAKKLVNRVREAIYAEYGHPAKKKDGTPISDEDLEKREQMFRLITDEFKLCRGKPVAIDDDSACKKSAVPLPGIGYWRKEAFEELSRKLLHAMITSDEFYVVLGGHSSAAGHGNNFMQSKMMQFHLIMEPVFDRLGMRLVSRNMAQGGVGTLGSVMAGADIYGESDLMIWDSEMTERDAGAHDLFNRQAILSGERVPVLLMPKMNDLEKRTDMLYAWGDGDTISPRSDFETGLLEKTKDAEHVETLPYAIRYMSCETGNGNLCKDNEYNSECWVRRSDYNPPKDTKIEKYVGGRASWHPGHRVHQLIGRKWSLIVLYALEAALDTWNFGMQEKGLPLANEYWHVGTEVLDTQYKIPPTYEEIRQKLRSYVPDNDGEVSKCEKLLHNFPIVCKVAMHGYTEWTPRALPEERSLRAILKRGPSGYLPMFSGVNAYNGFDILPPKWQIPEGEIDVHAIAIATTLPPPDDNNDPAGPMDYRADPSSEVEAKKGESEIDEQRLLTVSLPSAKSESHNDDISEEQQLAMRRLGEKLVHFGMEGHHLVPLRPAQQNRRLLTDEESQEIIPGEGWLYSGGRCGFCDGSFQSECQRSFDSTCPMKGHSDGRSGLLGDALSGWLVFEVPNVKEGIIILRLEVWKDPNSNTRTEGWTKGNTSVEDERPENINGLADNANAEGRRLFIPENDFYFDYAINGDIKTMDYSEFISYKEKVGKNMSLWPIMLPSEEKEQVSSNNKEKKGETVEVAIRLRSSAGRQATVAVSHLYYA
mmetsp:Transcript_18803/g.40951  ORF Transcript_18803/g.40951 Transcript_18803/m.40951 type:complete len:1025 (+) Transcript_18803:189-3263(+)